MASIGIVLHHGRGGPLAVATATWLAERGHEVRVPVADADAAGLTELAVKDDELGRGLDLALSLGGDGTILRTVHLVCGDGVPVLGVNVGQLGYLTEVEAAQVYDALERFLAGVYAIEERMTLAVAVHDPGGDIGPERRVALNEAVLEKSGPGHLVRLAVAVNDRPFYRLAADGMIVATPTGSTAYNLSARGPIVSPRHRALIVTPVAPHMLFDRALVLDATETVRVEVLDGPPATLSVDGNDLGPLPPGGAIDCVQGDRPARMVTFARRDFHQILKAKFNLADR